MTDRIIMGIDQSFRCTGIYITHEEKFFTIETGKDDRHLSTMLRCIEISKRILEISETFNVTHFAIEALPMKMVNGSSFKDLASLQGIIVTRIMEHYHSSMGRNVQLINPTQLKKYACGEGNGTKDDMFNALPADIAKEFIELPKTRGRFDITDAYFLARFAEENFDTLYNV